LLLDQNSEKLNKAIEKMDWDELSSIIDELRKDKKLK
jgi:Mg/Co/Ni transporter MgtE